MDGQAVHDTEATRGAGALGRVGVVAIGRNEGERLERCLRSMPAGLGGVVYVDSGSTDGSVAFARSIDADVVALDMSVPFTAARARNAGFAELRKQHPEIDLVQFVDGDCGLAEDWLQTATAALEARPDVVAVAGRRRELFRDATPFNRLCDLEWGQAPPGESEAFGGDVMVRATAFDAVGGYDPTLIAGEDPDFAVRLRSHGGTLLRLDADMTWHDADMQKLSQWWTRAKRCGYAYSLVSDKHRETEERFWSTETRRALTWGLVVPLAVPALAVPTLGASTLLLAAYPARAARLARRCEADGWSPGDARLWAANCIAASVPEAVGVLKHRLDQLKGRRATLIEYKGS